MKKLRRDNLFPFLFLFLSLLAYLACSGCSPNGESEMVGTYKLVHSPESESIRLLPDHSYVKISVVGEKQVQERGTWKLQNNGHLALSKPGSVDFMPVEKWFFTLYLGVDEDETYFYKKVD